LVPGDEDEGDDGAETEQDQGGHPDPPTGDFSLEASRSASHGPVAAAGRRLRAPKEASRWTAE
jgi:hypothetical protein